MQLITTGEILDNLHNKKYKLIDVRPVDAYNGWRLKDEARGGHIKGAKSLDAKWANYIDWIEIVRNKEILPENELVIYGYSKEEISLVAETFLKAGYENIRLYYNFIDEWCINPQMPMEKLERYNQLVSAQWLKDTMEGKETEHFNGNNLAVCHCHYRNPDDYFEGHIPGAISVDSLLLEAPETWNRRSPEELRSNLEILGISVDTTVVVYGRFSFPNNEDPFPGSSAGHLGAIRCAFIMMYAGVKDVKILNGGLQSWEDAKFATTKEETKLLPNDNFGIQIPARPELVIDTPEAKAYLADPNSNLVSVRSWPEFIGEVSGYNYIEKTGRIPGAVFGNCGTDAYHMENYRNLDHTMREAQEVKAIWEEVGITNDKRNAFYCGTGWRGSEAFMNAYLMGWENIALYDGGWFEWSNNPNNPYETGEPKN